MLSFLGSIMLAVALVCSGGFLMNRMSSSGILASVFNGLIAALAFFLAIDFFLKALYDLLHQL